MNAKIIKVRNFSRTKEDILKAMKENNEASEKKIRELREKLRNIPFSGDNNSEYGKIQLKIQEIESSARNLQ